MMNENLKKVWYIIPIVIIIIFYDIVGVNGFLAVIGVMLLIIAIRVFIKRKELALAIGHAETKIWGKPLEKKYWSPGELKNTKVRIRWKQNKKRQ